MRTTETASGLTVVAYPEFSDAAAAARATSPYLADHLLRSKLEHQGTMHYLTFDPEGAALASLKLVMRHVIDERSRISDITIEPRLGRRTDTAFEAVDPLLRSAEATSALTSLAIFSYLDTAPDYNDLMIGHGFQHVIRDRQQALELRSPS